jgi:F0F1-type ATP synthase assembly protein I
LQKQKELEEEARLAEIKRQEEQKKAEQKAEQEKILQNILTFLFLAILIGGIFYF